MVISMTDIKKLGIVGCGFVGSTIAYTMMESGLFSEMVLVDINEEKARGEAMDLNHCLPFLSPMQIYQDSYEGLRDAAVVVIAAGANQRPGETRTDLLNKNVSIFRDIIGNITRVNSECILLVVTNPVDVLTYYTLEISGFPRERVIGSGTVLDSARLKHLIGEKLKVDSRNVHTFILGEHGDSEFPVWSSANVSGIDMVDYCPICDKCGDICELYGIFDFVRDSAYEIIEAKGATYYAIAQAAKRIITSIVRDEKTILPVSTLVSGHYGVDGICLGVPSVVGRGGAEHVLDIPLDDTEAEKLRSSAEKMKELIAELDGVMV